jgi:hypothetical protein
VTDKATPLVLEALGRAVAEPAGIPLHGSKSTPGLFAASAAAKQAAQRCKDDGYLRVVRTETKGKTSTEICILTEKGLAFLLSQVSPKQVLEEFVRSLESRRAEVGQLLDASRQMHAGLDALRSTAEKVLQQVNRPVPPVAPHTANGAETWPSAILTHLKRWQESNAPDDCALPELYRQAKLVQSSLTIGQFHDGLRRLHEQQQVYLHPWTGPLYDLPDPPYALLVGHEIAYYASLRQ